MLPVPVLSLDRGTNHVWLRFFKFRLRLVRLTFIMRFVALMAARSRPLPRLASFFQNPPFQKRWVRFAKKAFSGGDGYAPGCAKPWGGKIRPMNYYGAKDLAGSFRTVRKNTITIAEEIGEQHYGFSPAPETRTVAQTLVHIGLGPQMAQQIHGVERPPR